MVNRLYGLPPALRHRRISGMERGEGGGMEADLLSRRQGRLARGMNDKSPLGKYSNLTFANESSIW